MNWGFPTRSLPLKKAIFATSNRSFTFILCMAAYVPIAAWQPVKCCFFEGVLISNSLDILTKRTSSPLQSSSTMLASACAVPHLPRPRGAERFSPLLISSVPVVILSNPGIEECGRACKIYMHKVAIESRSREI